jgi:hypothetical protein
MGPRYGHAMKARSPFEAARDSLYAAPLSEFVRLRARLAADLKAKGDTELAKALLALRRPNASAWGLNQLSRRRPERLGGLFTARAQAERAQTKGDAEEMRAAISEYRSRLDELVTCVETYLKEGGHAATREQLRGVREALDAAAQDPAHAGRELESGALVRALGDEDTEVRGLPLSIHHTKPVADRAVEKEPSAEVEKVESAVDLAARRLKEYAERRFEEANAALREAEARESEARAELHAAERKLEVAIRAVDQARTIVDAARKGLPSPGPKK